jgi:hypothetical protein
MKILILLFVSLLFFACSHTLKPRMSNLRLIKEGLQESQVLEILGEPTKRAVKEEYVLWSYDIYEDGMLTTRPYIARFKGGSLLMIHEDRIKMKEAIDLQKERDENRNKPLLDYTNTNQAPPLQEDR